MTPEQVARFWAKVDKSGGPDACWPWTKSKQSKGYGQFAIRIDGQQQWFLAHRTAYELTYGPLGPGMQALHRCDDPPCCNPAHLFKGTLAENMADKVAKGRQPSKLTATQVLDIRARYKHSPNKHGVCTQLAREFSITRSQISQIIHGKRWQHI